MKTQWALFLAVLVWGHSATVLAQGVVLQREQLSPSFRQMLDRRLALKHEQSPQSFQRLGNVRETLIRADAQKRGRLISVTRALTHLGSDALLPMLETLIIDDASLQGLSPSARLAWQVSLLEAVGATGEPDALPVFESVLAAPQQDYEIWRAAAQGLARMGDDNALSKLSQYLHLPGTKQRSVVAALGHCHRARSVALVANVLDQNADFETQRKALMSLGRMAGRWVWETSSAKHFATERDEVSLSAARALLKAFLSNTGTLRQDASDALLVVDEPSLPALIAEARVGASAEIAAALDILAARF